MVRARTEPGPVGRHRGLAGIVGGALLFMVSGCGEGLLGPDLPASATFAGITLRASAEEVDGRSTVRVSVTASNETPDVRSLETVADRAQVLMVVYRGSEIPVFDEAELYGGFQDGPYRIELAPGETVTLPERPTFDLREALGGRFRPGRYLVSARIPVWIQDAEGRRGEEVELRAGVVELR